MNKGFSLIEAIIGVWLVAILLLATYSIFILSQQTKRRLDNRAEITQNERAVLDRMTRELRQANALVPYPQAPALPSNEIKFEDGHNSLEQPNNIQYIRYFLGSGTNNQKLFREIGHYYYSNNPSVKVRYNDSGSGSLVYTVDEGGEGSNQSGLIGEYITALTFSGTDIITIAITFNKNNQAINLSTNVTPRNIK